MYLVLLSTLNSNPSTSRHYAFIGGNNTQHPKYCQIPSRISINICDTESHTVHKTRMFPPSQLYLRVHFYVLDTWDQMVSLLINIFKSRVVFQLRTMMTLRSDFRNMKTSYWSDKKYNHRKQIIKGLGDKMDKRTEKEMFLFANTTL